MSLVSMLKGKGPSGFGYGSTAEEVAATLALQGKTILLTGCSSGLGFEVMRVLASRGAHVIGTARTLEKASAAAAAVQGHVTSLACELSDPASVRACAQAIKQKGVRLDAIIGNAGLMALPKLELAHGYEMQFFANHIGHFILINALLGALADDGRVVMLSSSAHERAPKEAIQFDNLSGEKGYSPFSAYAQSKMANLLFTKELARRFAGTRKTANAVHPGVINTNLFRHIKIPRFITAIAEALALKNVGQGAATECYLAVHPAAAGVSGKYFADCNEAKSRPDANDPALSAKLWDVSEKIVAQL